MSAPRWQKAIEKAISENQKSVVVQLASSDSSTPYPQVRSLIFRSFLNPSKSPSLPVIVSTTDVRSPKTSQIISNSFVQLVWWIDGTNEQYRISGRAAIIPSPENSLHKHFMHSVNKQQGGLGRLSEETYDWEAKRKETFEQMSGHMRASWCRPVPGSKLEGGYEESKKWVEKVDKEGIEDDPEKKRLWELAYSNFALLVLDPMEIDWVELGVMPNRRTKFWLSDSRWEEELLVP